MEAFRAAVHAAMVAYVEKLYAPADGPGADAIAADAAKFRRVRGLCEAHFSGSNRTSLIRVLAAYLGQPMPADPDQTTPGCFYVPLRNTNSHDYLAVDTVEAAAAPDAPVCLRLPEGYKAMQLRPGDRFHYGNNLDQLHHAKRGAGSVLATREQALRFVEVLCQRGALQDVANAIAAMGLA